MSQKSYYDVLKEESKKMGGAIQTPSNSTGEIMQTYKNEAKNYKKDLENYKSEDSTLAKANANATNQKLEATNKLLDAYMQNQQQYASSKVQAQMAQQQAQNATKAYMEAAGLGGQGIAESSMINVGNNYANAVAGLEAEKNASNSSAQENYLNAIKDIDLAKDSEIANTMDSNAGLMNAKIDNALSEGDYSSLDRYKQEADKLYENGEISKTYYDSVVDNYNNEFKRIGVSDTKPTYTGDMGVNFMASWLSNSYNIRSTYAQEIASALSASKDGEVISLDNKTNLVKYNGKVYKTSAQASSNDGGIDVKYAQETDFGNYNDTGKQGSKQNTYINAVLDAGRQGKIPNGTTIDFNYGGGKDIYQYRNGKFYKVNKKGTSHYEEKNISKLIGKIDYK